MDGDWPYHVVGLKDLTLVGSTITVKSESDCLLLQVLLSEGDTGSNWNLGTDNTVTTEEGRCEDVHRSTLSVRHTVLSAWKLA
jgi:hypothetical protein